MTKPKAKKVEAVAQAEAPAVREVSQVVTFVKAKCPTCGSVRSRLIWNRKDEAGLTEYRRCKACKTEYRCIDETVRG